METLETLAGASNAFIMMRRLEITENWSIKRRRILQAR